MRRALLPLLLAASFGIACEERVIIRKAGTGSSGGVDGGSSGGPSTRPASNPLFIDLGEVTAGNDVTFEIPKGALGFNITSECDVEDFNEENPQGILRITDPKGNVIHDNFTPKGGTTETSKAVLDTIASVSVPQGDGVPDDLSGKWTLRVGQLNVPGSTIKTRVKVRVQSSGDGAYHGGRLDLHVHVADGLLLDGQGVAGASAKESAVLNRRVDGFFKLLKEQLDIDRGEVTYHSEAPSFKSIVTVEKLLAGFSVAGGADGTQAFHILFTNEIKIDGIPEAQGISPGIPGAANVFGRNVSGIIIAVADLDLDLLTMFHEMGHFIGLNHTTELDGTSADPLSDTPRCSTITDHNFGRCPDRNNVMFAAGGLPPGPMTLAPSQKRIYRGSPIYKAFTSGQKTQSREITDTVLAPHYRVSGRPLSPIETVLSSGFCAHVSINPNNLVAQYGKDETIAQLRAVAADEDLLPYIRGRATSALRTLDAK